MNATSSHPRYDHRRPRTRETRNADVVDLIGSSLTDGLRDLIDAIDQSTQSLSDRLARPPVTRRQTRRPRSRGRGKNRECSCGEQPCYEDRCCGNESCCGAEGCCGGEDCCGNESCCGGCNCSSKVVSCECQCCISDADLVVQARLFELRVIPVVLHNSRRREREISLQLGSFTTRGGKPAPVLARIVGPTKLTLKPCEEQTVNIAIAMRDADGDDGDDAVGSLMKGNDNQRELPDVDDCVVAYGHLTVDGCDVRPVRIAVAILPRNCGAHRVKCACGCC